MHRNREPTQYLPPTTTNVSQERAPSLEDESSDSSDSSTDISSSSSEAPGSVPDLGAVLAQISDGDSDDDSASNRKNRKTGDTPATIHEILAPQVTMPSITSVEPSETIELVGEVLSLVDSVVVVKSFEHGQYKVLDTDSLFVLEDRKVLGLVRPSCHLIKGFRVTCPLGLRNLWSSNSTSLLPSVPFRLRLAHSTSGYQTWNEGVLLSRQEHVCVHECNKIAAGERCEQYLRRGGRRGRA